MKKSVAAIDHEIHSIKKDRKAGKRRMLFLFSNFNLELENQIFVIGFTMSVVGCTLSYIFNRWEGFTLLKKKIYFHG